MILRNHGAVICGETIEHVFHLLLAFMDACTTQVSFKKYLCKYLIFLDGKFYPKVKLYPKMKALLHYSVF